MFFSSSTYFFQSGTFTRLGGRFTSIGVSHAILVFFRYSWATATTLCSSGVNFGGCAPASCSSDADRSGAGGRLSPAELRRQISKPMSEQRIVISPTAIATILALALGKFK